MTETTKAREDCTNWDETWMGMAIWMAQRSKDPNTQVGACVVGIDNVVKALGYNGFPRNVDNYRFSWNRKGSYLDTKYPFVCHAESNAIDNRGANSLEDCTLYVTLFPCNECAKRIIQNRIKHVIYLHDKYPDEDFCKAAKMLFEEAGVTTAKFMSDRVFELKFT